MCLADILGGPVRSYECGTGTGRPGHITKSIDCRDILMSLLAYTVWISPDVWTPTAHCSATLSATLSSLASEVPTQAGNNRCRRTVQHGETASGSMMKEPWPKPVDDSLKTRIPAKRAFHPFPEISAPEVSKSQGVFS